MGPAAADPLPVPACLTLLPSFLPLWPWLAVLAAVGGVGRAGGRPSGVSPVLPLPAPVGPPPPPPTHRQRHRCGVILLILPPPLAGGGRKGGRAMPPSHRPAACCLVVMMACCLLPHVSRPTHSPLPACLPPCFLSVCLPGCSRGPSSRWSPAGASRAAAVVVPGALPPAPPLQRPARAIHHARTPGTTQH